MTQREAAVADALRQAWDLADVISRTRRPTDATITRWLQRVQKIERALEKGLGEAYE